jgi:hypothetical protein
MVVRLHFCEKANPGISQDHFEQHGPLTGTASSFPFARWIRQKTLARIAEKNRRRELEEGFNGIADERDERIRAIKELAEAYLAEYKLRHKAVTYAEYALGNVFGIWARGCPWTWQNGRSNPVAHRPSLEKMGVRATEVVNVGGFTAGQKHFLKYHRDCVLLKAR